MANGIATLVLQFLALAAAVNAHGYLTGLITPTKSFNNVRRNVGWESQGGLVATWVDEKSYASRDIVCGPKYESGTEAATVAAGSTVRVIWNRWIGSHRGVIIDYLAYCGEDCANVDKTKLEFFKIGQSGLIETPRAPNEIMNDTRYGYWATDKLISQAKRIVDRKPPKAEGFGDDPYWEIKIPRNLKRGMYTLRTEIIALNSNKRTEHYPRCINLDITGKGSASTRGVRASELYSPNEPGITARYKDFLKSYTFPGPPVFQG